MNKIVIAILFLLLGISCSNGSEASKKARTECIETVKKLLFYLRNNDKTSVSSFYLQGPVDDSLGFDTKIQHASTMLLKCDSNIIEDAIQYADSSNMKIYSPGFNEYQLKLYSKKQEYLGEIIFSFNNQHCDKISNIFVDQKPIEIKVNIDEMLDSNGNLLLQTWR